MKPKPYPRTLPPMPKGQVYLGKGGEFEIPKKGSFSGFIKDPDAKATDKGWQPGTMEGNARQAHYCAPADSEVARLNGLAPAKKAPRKAAKKAVAKDEKYKIGDVVEIKTLDEWEGPCEIVGLPTPSTGEYAFEGIGKKGYRYAEEIRRFKANQPTLTPALVLEAGKTYLTRCGKEARVLCVDIKNSVYPVAATLFNAAGEEILYAYRADGTFDPRINSPHPSDIISLAPDFDWSCLPPWINYIAMTEGKEWHGYIGTPIELNHCWDCIGEGIIHIPPQYAPTNQPSDWRQSLRVRPGYNPSESTK